MAKDPGSIYEAGRRGQSWLKIKPANTLDLVALAVGRSSIEVAQQHPSGALDPESGQYVMLGKTFKGMTDETLQWQTDTFQDYATRDDSYVTYLRPHFVA